MTSDPCSPPPPGLAESFGWPPAPSPRARRWSPRRPPPIPLGTGDLGRPPQSGRCAGCSSGVAPCRQPAAPPSSNSAPASTTACPGCLEYGFADDSLAFRERRSGEGR